MPDRETALRILLSFFDKTADAKRNFRRHIEVYIRPVFLDSLKPSWSGAMDSIFRPLSKMAERAVKNTDRIIFLEDLVYYFMGEEEKIKEDGCFLAKIRNFQKK